MADRQMPGVAVRTQSSEYITGDTTNSPARGRETRTALLGKLRPPPLVHAWDFWFEKEGSGSIPNQVKQAAVATATSLENSPASVTSMETTSTNFSSTASNSTAPTSAAGISSTIVTPHNTTLTSLHSITDIRHFWSLFNNFSFSTLPPRVSVHLFHNTVTPTWEDPRNTRGGAWTFRMPRPHGSPFFRALALTAIAERLQEAVYDEKKLTFRDDICGISFSVRNEKTVTISVWNRDAANEIGKQKLLKTIIANLPGEIKPSEGSYYYKAHNSHAAFASKSSQDGKEVKINQVGKTEQLEAAQERSQEVSDAMQDLGKEYEKVRKILEEVKVADAEMDHKLATDVGREEGQVEDGVRPKSNADGSKDP